MSIDNIFLCGYVYYTVYNWFIVPDICEKRRCASASIQWSYIWWLVIVPILRRRFGYWTFLGRNPLLFSQTDRGSLYFRSICGDRDGKGLREKAGEVNSPEAYITNKTSYCILNQCYTRPFIILSAQRACELYSLWEFLQLCYCLQFATCYWRANEHHRL